ncbi:flavin reductase family protein [Nocardia arthritidis]|uniref:flavin reductase family protein n=1 Tax=Nocardia arthritidis TaxID=228602 RepID=UPI000A43054E|nr:iron-sulfur cluster-binding domain-containing protein [Nocardia arthritidis]
MALAAELSVGHPDNVMIHPRDEKGLIDLDSILGQPQVVDTSVYACGPAALLDAVAERCKNWQPDALHVERFTSLALEKATTGGSFEVTLARSGMTLTVAGEQSIPEAVTEAGVIVQSSCNDGVCGTRETTVLEGVVAHRESLLSRAEKDANGTMMICVSRADGGRWSSICRSDWIRHGGRHRHPRGPLPRGPASVQVIGPMFADRAPLRLAELLEAEYQRLPATENRPNAFMPAARAASHSSPDSRCARGSRHLDEVTAKILRYSRCR